MATNITEFASAGLSAIQIGARGGDGSFRGFGKLATTDTGQSSGMRRVRGAVTGANPVPDTNRVRNRGDDGYIATHLFEAEPPDFNLEFEQFDLDAEGFLTGSSIYTLGQWDSLVRGQGIPVLQDTIAVLSRQSESQEALSTGNGYDNLFIFSSKYRPTPGDYAWQAAGTQVFNGAADRVLVSPFGVLISDMAGQSDGMTWQLFSEYPITMVCFIGDGTLAIVPLPYAPISVAKTKFFDFATGVALTVSSVDVNAETATLSAAPASGAVVVGIFETNEL